ncbi:MAG: hypothetical protein M1812_007876 [Candelaria pacifica]|nr:MAG: hypothetical protein M1812_007876 [Candelaria pacifica]
MATIAAVARTMTTSHLLRNCCSILGKHKSANKQVKVMGAQWEGLKVTSGIPPRVVTIELPALDRAKVNARVGMLDPHALKIILTANKAISSTADGEYEEKEVAHSDKSTVIHAIDDGNTDTDDEFTTSRDKPVLQSMCPDLGPKNWDDRATSTWKKFSSPGNPIIDQDESTDSGGNDTLREQGGNQGSLSTPSTSIAGSDAG